ncbi:MAG: beta-galactosidase small subunit, partial [Candidatus Aminicenantes bacterium]|nr:beta-galactosidase small subunit [Candidatus Aminicenantes bacterium]
QRQMCIRDRPLIPEGFVVASEQIPIQTLPLWADSLKALSLGQSFYNQSIFLKKLASSNDAESLLQSSNRLSISSSQPELPPIKIKETEQELILEAKEVTVIFNRKSGLIKSYKFKGKEFFKEEPVPYFWRAPTDNDFGNRMPQRCALWRQASHHRQLQQFSYKLLKYNQIKIETTLLLPDVPAQHKIITFFNDQGELLINNSFTPQSEKELPEIPRMGMKFILPASFSSLEWYGRGPHENYVDRKTSAFIGRYQDNVRSMKNPYVAAQEYGNRCENRWLTVRNEAGFGLMIIGLPDFEFSALPYTPDDLTQKWRGELHAYQVEPKDFTCLLISDMVTGVGGDDSWGARPHPQYEIPARPYDYAFILRPLD